MLIEFRSLRPIVDDLDAVVDWIEVNALAWGAVDRGLVLRYLRDRELVPDTPEELYLYGIERGDVLAPVDAGEALLDEIWARLRAKANRAPAAYPFLVEDGQVQLKPAGADGFLCYTSMLVFDIGHAYPQVDVKHHGGHPFYTHFENIVTASLQLLLGGPAFRFGVPVNDGEETNILARAKKMGKRFGVKVVGAADLDQAYGDQSLDVLVRHQITDALPGSAYVLVQCAAGEGWRKKRTEPFLEVWREILRFDGAVYRAIAYPLRLVDPEVAYGVQSRYFTKAAIFDRARLSLANGDPSLHPSATEALRTWLTTAIEAIKADV